MLLISSELNSNDYQEIERLISQFPNKQLELSQIWQLMDQVWDEFGCDNQNLNKEKINAFYKHPIWLLNGFFIEQHDISLQHRHAISDWIINHSINNVVDFGGGFGTLARIIAQKSNIIQIDIYEPYPSEFAISQCSSYPQIKFVSKLENKYDCLVSTDVLEHVLDPLVLFSQMIDNVNINGYLIIANCFYPVIKCHLPSTFHLRYSFDRFAEDMGLKVIGKCEGSHGIIYQKIEEKSLNWSKIRTLELISKLSYPLREFNNNHVNKWKYRLKMLLTNPRIFLKKLQAKLNK